jgi:hypothetical protein
MRAATALPEPPLEGQKLALRRSGFPRALASGLRALQPANTNRENPCAYDEGASESCKWTSKDPIFFAGDPINLYGYVSQDPVNDTDPSGEDPNAVAALCATRGAPCAAYQGHPSRGEVGGLVGCRRTYTGGLPGGFIKYTCSYSYPDGDQCTFFNGSFIGICNSFFPKGPTCPMNP